MSKQTDLINVTDAITVDGSNNVGIGTSSPDKKLNVVDSTALQAEFSGYSHASTANNARAASGSIRLGNGGGTTGLLIDYTDQGQTVGLIKNEYVATGDSELRLQSPFLSFYTGTSASERLRIDSSGNLLFNGNGVVSVQSSSNNMYIGGGTYTPAELNLQAGTSFMRMYTNGSERMRIDSSGNLLVGGTSAYSVDAATITSGGQLYASRTSANAIEVNRSGTDGEIVRLQKAGSTVGSIGTVGGATYYGGTSKSLRIDTTGFRPATNTGAYSDNTVSLGASSVRFKDLYLSGGVYLGGTGSANKLDDYEEGEFTLVVSGSSTAGTNSGGSRGGRYTKVGRLVTCNIVVANTTLTGASGNLQLTGFPFTAQNYANRPPVGCIRMYQQDLDSPSSGYFSPVISISHNTNIGEFVQTRDNGTWSVVQVENGSGLYFEGTISYTTDA